MTAYNVVRFRTKPGNEQASIMHTRRRASTSSPGPVGGYQVLSSAEPAVSLCHLPGMRKCRPGRPDRVALDALWSSHEHRSQRRPFAYRTGSPCRGHRRHQGRQSKKASAAIQADNREAAGSIRDAISAGATELEKARA